MFALVPGILTGVWVVLSLHHRTPSSVHLELVFLGIGGGLVLGGLGGIVGGVAFGTAFGFAIAISLGIGLETRTIGVLIGIGVGIAFGSALGVADGVIRNVAFLLTSLVVGTLVSSVVTLSDGILCVGASILTYFRIPLYLLEVAIETTLKLLQSLGIQSTLNWAPVLHHDLSYFPHPFLAAHIVESAGDPSTVRRALAACEISPGQRAGGRRALASLQAGELKSLASQKGFQQAAKLQGLWLPGIQAASNELLAFREMAQHVLAASVSMIATHRLDELLKAENALQGIKSQLLDRPTLASAALQRALTIWGAVINGMLEPARAEAARLLPVPFYAGPPLAPDLGQLVFRGREGQLRQIETILADSAMSASIVLLGPRRSGKTSLLKMLQVMLPDAQCIFFDVQANIANSPQSFLTSLHKQVLEQSTRDRRIAIPNAAKGDLIETTALWFEELEKAAGERRILICIDEFERLEGLFGGEHKQLLQLLGLFRATIQHRRKLKLLVSGVAPFDELGSLWDDHFINTQEVRIGHLDRPTSLNLLTKPTPDFPDDAIPSVVAEKIFHRTGGQPYLLQMYGSMLVQWMNDGGRRIAGLSDVDVVEDRVLEACGTYFRSIISESAAPTVGALTALASGRNPKLDTRTRKWLERRCLITSNQLSIPVFGKWIAEQQSN
jgi:hypothetical protein